MDTITERIQYLRAQEGLDVAGLARIAECSESLVHMWERGARPIRPRHARNIEVRLHYSSRWLLRGERPMRTAPGDALQQAIAALDTDADWRRRLEFLSQHELVITLIDMLRDLPPEHAHQWAEELIRTYKSK